MGKRIIAAAAVAVLAGVLGPASPAAARCSGGPTDTGDETVHLVNPVTNGRVYVDVDGDGSVKAGVTNENETSYIEVEADSSGRVVVHGYNSDAGTDGRFEVSSDGVSACPEV